MKKHHIWLITAVLFIIHFEISYSQNPSYILKTDSTEISTIDLDEVEVNSRRENYKIRELPASVSLLSSKKIKEAGVEGIKDLTSLVPNFFMPDYGSKLTSPVYIRGIGSRIDSPSAGLYIDNVPYFDKAAFDFDLFDIESIEVLRGPQGTLYGRNTIGGLVNINTRSPLNHQGTRLAVSGGNYGYLSGNLSHYQKLNDATAFSLAGNYMQRDGYHMNEYLNKQVDAITSYGARTRFIRIINQKIQAEVMLGFEKLDQGGYPYALFNDSLKKAEVISYNHASSFKRNMASASFSLGYTSNSFTVNYTAGYQFLEGFQAIDQDFTPANLFFVTQDQEQNLFSQEIIVKSAGDGRFKFTNGAFWFHQSLIKYVDANYLEDAVPIYRLPGKMTLHRYYNNPSSGGALFHQSTLEDLLINNLSVTAGIRMDTEKTVLDYASHRDFGGGPVSPTELESELSFFEFLPKIAVKYIVSPGKWTYLSAARGYKTGGFNISVDRDEDRSFLPEYTWNYEAGAKLQWSSMLSAEMSVFYINWKDQQIYQPIPTGTGSMLKNAGHSYSRGAEFSLRAQTIGGVDLSMDYGLTDARFISHKIDSVTSYDGNRIPYVPEHTLTISGGKKFELMSKWADSFTARANYQFTGKHYWNEENTHFQEGYGLLNSRLSLTKNLITLDLWAKNIMGKPYNSFYFEAVGNQYVQIGKPFSFGANLILSF